MTSNDSSVVIAVMGMTGVGKSSFIRSVSGRKDVVVGHTLSSGLRTHSAWLSAELI